VSTVRCLVCGHESEVDTSDPSMAVVRTHVCTPPPVDVTAEQRALDERMAEARELAAEWESLPVTRVAVVVFVDARGRDAADARDRAVGAVWRQLLAKDNGHLPTTQRGVEVPTATMNVISASDVGRAAANGHLSVTVGRAMDRGI
jgi:hypothetical protein